MTSRVYLLLAALLAFDATWAKLDVLVEPSTLTAKAGDKVQLKCILQNLTKPLVLKSYMVQWFKRGVQVAEYDDKIIINKPGLSMSLEAIQKGDATLTIESFSAEYAGSYRCYVYYNTDTEMKQIDLSDVAAPKEVDVPLSTCETILEKKLDTIIKWSEQVNTKLEELKKCPK
ncbi:uncharacterized protein ACMZJ9_010233 [Mantella aurantiaca]